MHIGQKASSVARVRDERSGAEIAVSWLNGGNMPGAVAKGYVVYAGAVGAGSAALTRADRTGVEQYVSVPGGALGELRYQVRLGDKVAGLRQVKGVPIIEFLDEHGNPGLRMTAPVAVAAGHKVPLRLEVTNCAVDRNPAQPWGRPVVDPGSRSCEVHVLWDRQATEGHEILVDPAWTSTGDMSAYRKQHHAHVLPDGKVLVIGITPDVYNPSTGTWAATGPMEHKSRTRFASCVLQDGKVLVAGGKVSTSEVTYTEWYDPVSGTWTSTGDLLNHRELFTMSTLSNGKVIAVGGIVDGYNTATVETYTPSTGKWLLSLKHLHVARNSHTATVLSNGNVLVVGGYASASPSKIAELYNASTKTWSSAGTTTYGRSKHTATLLNNGQVLVVGGYDGSSYLKTAEIYDPVKNSWTTTASMAVARSSHTASLLSNGHVLVAGGYEGGAGLNSVELFHLGKFTGIWDTSGAMLTNRTEHTASVLKDGRILVAGGAQKVGVSWTTLKSAELWSPAQNGETCTYDSECASGHCVDGVCCDESCTQSDHACTQAKTGEADGTCAPVRNGYSCVQGNECGSGFCADGVCCGSACDGRCQACVAAKTGEADGTCASIPLGSDPDKECPDTGSGTCQLPGTCDGKGACATQQGQACGNSASCSGDYTLTLGQTCDANGTCGTASTLNCSPYLCRNNACLTSCTSANDCVSPQACKDYKCGGLLGDGQKCTTDAQCTSNHCADGVCCNEACSGKCMKCDGTETISGSAGVCSPVRSGYDPDGECAKDTSNACGNTGECDGKGACALAPSTKTCGVECESNSTVTKKCSGTGVCSADQTTAKSCKPFACYAQSGLCNLTCATGSDCVAPTNNCLNGKCVVYLSNGDACEHGEQCQSGHCADKVCCDSACNGTCKRCDGLHIASGSIGVCSPVSATEDPDGECQKDTSNECGKTGFCDGKGSCGVADTTQECGFVCDSNNSLTQRCDGKEHCKAVVSTAKPCKPYGCSTVTGLCRTTCATNDDCLAPNKCADGKCQTLGVTGARCKGKDECDSGHCVEGVCCDTACEGSCMSCVGNQTGQADGHCVSVLAGNDDPKGMCQVKDPPCGADGKCDGSGHCRQSAPKGTDCGQRCAGDAVLKANCTGSGQCLPDAKTSKTCFPYACDQSLNACLTICSSSNECSEAAKCDPQSGKCAPTQNTCKDDFTVVATDGTESDCSPYKCNAGTCRDSCTLEDDCQAGYQCEASRCVKATSDQAAEASESSGCGCRTAGGTGGSSSTGLAGLMLALGLAFGRRRRPASSID